QIKVKNEARPTRLLIPGFFMLFVPALSALFIRRRATASGNRRINWIVWMTWIDLGAWLYWISSARISDIAELPVNLGIELYPLQLLIGLAIFAGTPLAGIAAGIVALGPVITQKPGRIWRMAGVRIAAESQILVPLGIFELSSALGFM